MIDLSQPLKDTLASHLAASGQAIAAIDYDQVIRFFNDGAERIFRYSSEEVLGRPLELLIPEWARQDHRKYVERFFAGKEVARLKKQRLSKIFARRKDGSEFPAEVSISKIVHEDTEFAVFILTEKSDPVMSQEAVRRAQKMETIGHLASGLAHDLNNQLSVIIGCLELLDERTANDAEARELLAVARSASQRSAALTGGLLRFGRSESTRQAMSPGTVIEESLTLLEQSIGERVTLQFDTGSTSLIHADRMQFENAIANLVLNARDAMPEGGLIAIAVDTVATDAAGRESPSGNWVRVRVTDTGGGMSEDIKEQVTKPFFTTKPPDQGTGLGLSMVHGFVSSSDGSLDIDSAVGAGTTIEMYFPQYHGERQTGEVTSRDSKARASGSGSILVVEDDAPLRSLMMRQLGLLGYEPRGAEDATRALEILQSNESIRLVVTDMIMPGRMSGVDLARHVRETWPRTGVLLVSGYDTEDVRELVESTTASGNLPLLKKPFSRTELAEAIETCLESG